MRTTKGALYTRKTKKYGNVYWLHFQVNQQRFRQKLVSENGEPITNRKAAEKAAAKILHPYLARDEVQRRKLAADALGDALETVKEFDSELQNKLSLEEAWNAYLDSPKRPDSSSATLRQYSFQWDRFLKWTQPHDLKYLSDVTPEHGEKYAQELKRSGLTSNTRNKHIRLLKLVFRVLEQNSVNPFHGISNLTEEQESRKELAWDTLCRICDQAEGELKTLLFLGIYTGQRLKDCVLLQWDSVDLMRGWLLMRPAKTKRRSNGKPLHIPILPDLRYMLEITPEDKRQGYVLPELAAKYLKSNDRITDMVQRLFRNCGVEIYKPGTGHIEEKQADGTTKRVYSGKRAVIQYGFHSLKHTTVSLLQQAGVPQSVVQEIVGNRTTAMIQRYTHVGHEAIQNAMKTLPAISSTPPGHTKKDESEARRQLRSLADDLPIASVEKLLSISREMDLNEKAQS